MEEGKKKTSVAQQRATKKYHDKNNYSVLVRFRKSDEQRIRQAAGDSVNGFIVRAVLEKVSQIEQEQKQDNI